MKKNILSKIEVPSEITVELNETKLRMEKNGKEIVRVFKSNPKITIGIDGKSIVIRSDKATKRELKLINSTIAHIKNMISGLNNPFVYKLEICNVHFPMVVKTENGIVKIKNFLGEKIDRQVEMSSDVDVKISGNIIEVSSPNIEAAGQFAAKLEIATKIKNRDRRVFQDGIFITEKPGKK